MLVWQRNKSTSISAHDLYLIENIKETGFSPGWLAPCFMYHGQVAIPLVPVVQPVL
jgi:hypothetical protein